MFHALGELLGVKNVVGYKEWPKAQIILKAAVDCVASAQASYQRTQPMYQTAQTNKSQSAHGYQNNGIFFVHMKCLYGSTGPLLYISFTPGPEPREKACQLYDQGKESNDKALQNPFKVSSKVTHFTSTHISQSEIIHMAKLDHSTVKNKILPQGDPSREGRKHC